MPLKGVLMISLLALLISSCKSNADAQEIQKGEKEISEESVGELYQDFNANPANRFQEEKNALIEYATNNGLSVVGTPTGLYYEIEDIGTGDYLKKGDPVVVHYRGVFLDGKEFDSSYARGEPIKFKVGEMNAGWNEGLTFMKKGDKATLLLPSRIAYGEKGFPGYIGPNTPIVFELVVLEE